MRFPDVHRSADERFVDTWYRKKTGTAFDNTRTISLSGWIPDDTPADVPALAPFATSTVLDTSPQACWAWAVPPWLRLPADASDAPRSYAPSSAPAPAGLRRCHGSRTPDRRYALRRSFRRWAAACIIGRR
jgi:hypothetical protein